MLRTLLICALALLASPALAGNVVELENGEFVLKDELPLVKRELNVTVTEAAAAYPDTWREALQNPGTSVPAETVAEYEPVNGFTGILLLEQTTRANHSVVYDQSAGYIDVVNDLAPLGTKEVPNFTTLFGAIAIVLLGFGYLLLLHGRRFLAALHSVGALIAIIFAVANVATLDAVSVGYVVVAVILVSVIFPIAISIPIHAYGNDVVTPPHRKHGATTAAAVVASGILITVPWW